MFSEEQRRILLEPIKPHRVSQDGKGFSHLEAYEVIAHLNRLFGFEGWSKEIRDLSLVLDEQVEWTVQKTGERKRGWDVAYRCSLRLTIAGPAPLLGPTGTIAETVIKEDAAVGSATHQPNRIDAHDLAMKSAVSGALKRCAKDLGDQFGLSLYDEGKTAALVRKVIPYEFSTDALLAPRGGNGGGGSQPLAETSPSPQLLEDA